MATRTISNAGGSWNTTGAWVEGAVPLASDDVVATATSGPLTVTAASVCRSMILTGYTNTISGSGAISIGDASGGACTLAGTISGTWTTSFVSTSTNGGAGWGITSNGKSFPGAVSVGVGASGGGKWVLQDALSVTGALSFLSSGTFDWNGKSITAASLSLNGTATRTLTPGASAVALTAAAGMNTRFNGLTITANAATVTLSGTSSQFSVTTTAGDFNGMSFVLNGGGNAAIQGVSGWTCKNFTRTGTALKTDSLSLKAFTWTGTLTLSGNTTQGINRLLVFSPTRGTSTTLTGTGAAVVINGDVDFMDVAISGAPSWTNAGSAFVGDAGGNGSLITSNRTTPATQTATGTASFSWSTHGWTSRVPLPQDTVSVPNAFIASRVVTVDMPRIGADVTFTCTGNPALSVSAVHELYGSLTFATGMTMSLGNDTTFAGRGTHTITSNGVSHTNTFTVDAATGSYTLTDAFASSTTQTFNLTSGTFNDGGFSMTFTGASGNRWSVNGATLVMSGIWSTSVTSTVNIWNVTSGTVTHTGSIVVTAASANTRTFVGGGQTYGTLTYTVAGSTGQLTITGSNTFDTINFSDVTNARTLAFTSGTTTTVTNFNVNGTAGKLMTVNAVTGGVAATLSKPSGAVVVYFVSLADNTATGGATWSAMSSTAGSGVTGWSIGNALLAASDTAQALDSATRALLFGRTATDTAGAVDAAVRVSGVLRTASDAAPASDSAAAPTTRTASDTAQALDAASGSRVFARSSSDAASASDSASGVAAIIRTVSDDAHAADSATSAVSLVRSGGDQAQALDTAARALVEARLVSDTAEASDVAVTRTQTGRSAADDAPAADSAVRAPRELVGLSTDHAGASDAVSGLVAVLRLGADTAPATDVASAPVVDRATDAAPATDSADRSVLVHVSATDLARATDSAARSFLAGCVDAARAVDAVTGRVLPYRYVTFTAGSFVDGVAVGAITRERFVVGTLEDRWVLRAGVSA